MKNSTQTRKVAFYIRVSTERQAKVEEGSLKNQEQMLRSELEMRNLQRLGWGVFSESYVDEGISAMTTNRPAFQRLMRDIDRGWIDTVMFTELSRLSRSFAMMTSLSWLLSGVPEDRTDIKNHSKTPYGGWAHIRTQLWPHRTA